MRMPFVSRGVYEDALARERRLLETVEKLTEDMRDLTVRVMDMRRDGFVPGPPQPRQSMAPVPPPTALPEVVRQAIFSVSKPGTETYTILCEQAQAAVETGQDHDMIAAEIREGSRDYEVW